MQMTRDEMARYIRVVLRILCDAGARHVLQEYLMKTMTFFIVCLFIFLSCAYLFSPIPHASRPYSSRTGTCDSLEVARSLFKSAYR